MYQEALIQFELKCSYPCKSDFSQHPSYVTCPLKITRVFHYSQGQDSVFSLTYQPSRSGLCPLIFSSCTLFPHDVGEGASSNPPPAILRPTTRPCIGFSRPWNTFPTLLPGLTHPAVLTLVATLPLVHSYQDKSSTCHGTTSQLTFYIYSCGYLSNVCHLCSTPSSRRTETICRFCSFQYPQRLTQCVAHR